MSLIINMLKDLDQRHNNNVPAPALVTAHQNHAESSSRVYQNLIGFITIVLITALAYSYFHKKPVQISVLLPTESPIIKSALNEPTENTVMMPVTISGVSFETKSDATDIIFSLSHDALYRLVGDEKLHTLNLYIDNASLRSDLPTLVGAEISVQKLTASSSNGSMKFSLILKPGANLRSVNLNKQNDNAELIVSINNPPISLDEPIKVTGGIKTPAMQTVLIDQYQSAVKLSEAGDKTGAITKLNKLLGYYPDYDDARVALAAITLELGDAVQSRKIIDDGLAMSPDYLPLIELKARLLASEGKIKEALMVLQSEQPQITEAPAYHALIAALYNREENYNLAAEIYQKLVRINPHDGSWWFGLGVSLDKLGRGQDAVYAYTKAATEGRLNAPALSFLQARLQSLQDSTHA